MRHLLLIDEAEFDIGLTPAGDGRYTLLLGDEITPVALDGDRLTVGNTTQRAVIAVEGDVAYVHIDGATHRVEFRDAIARHAKHGAAGAEDVISAPMPGSVVAVNVAAGDAVEAGQVLIVIESMKLETAIKAPRAGTIDIVHVAPAKTFNKGAPLVALAPVTEA